MTPTMSAGGIRLGSGAGAWKNEDQLPAARPSRSVHLKDELVDPHWDRSNKNLFEHLVMLFTFCATDVGHLPFQVYRGVRCHESSPQMSPLRTVRELLYAFECNLKLEGVVEGGRIVQYGHIRQVHGSHLYHACPPPLLYLLLLRRELQLSQSKSD